MTAHAMKEDMDRCLAAGMNDYVSKPINPQQLIEAVQKWTGLAPDRRFTVPSLIPEKGASE